MTPSLPGSRPIASTFEAWLSVSLAHSTTPTTCCSRRGFKASHADLRDVQNLTGWLTTVTARESLDVLRARKRRGEVALPDDQSTAGAPSPSRAAEEEVVLAESVGRALLVVLDRLTPAERVALVLHDMFTVPFDEIAPIVDRSPIAAKKLASRARQKVAGERSQQRAESGQQRRLADAFLSASHRGDITGLLAVLAPDVVAGQTRPRCLPAGRPRSAERTQW
jgi:RNA polymerase sigma-70 factor, ECF subfamily